VAPAPEREWTVEAHLRGTTFGTEAQAHATAERWRQLVATSAQRDVELLDVVVRGPDGHQTDECRAVVFHGPGHQSRTSCEEVDPHELHEARLVVAGHTVFWRGQEAVTGPFDESPLDEDDPYTHVESRGYFVVCCRSCDDGRPTPQPFSTAWERMAWYRAHAEGTGHEDFFVLDPTGETPSPDRLGSWVGTVAYEDVHRERVRAHVKHDRGDVGKYGADDNTSMERMPFDHPLWLAVLAEEFGEGVGRAVIEGRVHVPEHRTPEGVAKLREELVQLAAMTIAWIDAIDLDEVYGG
jgi:hypothetical protein